MRFRPCISVLFLLLSAGLSLHAQEGNSFYQMQYVPQNNLMNPAVQSSCKYYLAMPGLSSLQVSYNNPVFTYNDLVEGAQWNISGLAEQVHRRDLYSLELSLPILAFGFHIDKHYFHFHAGDRALINQGIPGKLVELGVYGNYSLAGDNLNFTSLRPGAWHLREYALGYSRKMDLIPELTLGGRLKLLFGKASLYTADSQTRFLTDESNFALHAETDYQLRSSFPLTILSDDQGMITGIELGEITPLSYLLNGSNPGLGMDLGATWDYSPEWRFSASILDVAAIWWRDELNEISLNGNFDFEGPESISASTGNYTQELLDSLLNSVELSTGASSWVSALPPRIFLAATWNYSPRVKLGATGQSVFYRSKLQTAISLSADYEISSGLHALASWSWMNSSLLNLGLGLAYAGKGLQFHLVSDNVLAAFRPMDSQSASLRLGLGVMFGCPREREARIRAENSPVNMVDGQCNYPESSKRIQRKRKRATRRMNR